MGALEPQLLKATKNHILRNYEVSDAAVANCIPHDVTHWGRIRFLNGGDSIRGADLVPHSETNMTRDASFIKAYINYRILAVELTVLQFSHDVDKNQNHRRLPVVLERRIAYGQLLRVIEFFADIPPALEDAQPRNQARSLLLGVVRPVKLHRKNHLGTPYYQDGKFSPLEVIDVDDVSCLVARIPDHTPGPRLWALSERQDAMGKSDDDIDVE
ncbi:hypothetical protein K438DRAFT_1749526 [Mycena galopus ATCC 62051]|nr:hypothetical protein K438DRAFT_1749526 [Mycena galopus ATCC 62051]